MQMAESLKKRPGVTTEIQTITPTIAAEMLEGNTNNRSLAEGRVKSLAAMMAAGEWKIAQPVMFDYNGKLVDGQHRLQAVIRSGMSVRFLVVHGIEPEAFSVVDQGKSRTATDLHHIMGGTNSAVNVAVAASMICGVAAKRAGNISANLQSASPSRIKVAKFAIEHALVIDQFVSILHKANYATSPIIAAFCNAHELFDGKPDILEMAQRFADRAFLGVDDPMNRLTTWCLNYCGRHRQSSNMRKNGMNMRREMVYAAAVTAIVGSLRGKPMKLLKPSERDFDELL